MERGVGRGRRVANDTAVGWFARPGGSQLHAAYRSRSTRGAANRPEDVIDGYCRSPRAIHFGPHSVLWPLLLHSRTLPPHLPPPLPLLRPPSCCVCFFGSLSRQLRWCRSLNQFFWSRRPSPDTVSWVRLDTVSVGVEWRLAIQSGSGCTWGVVFLLKVFLWRHFLNFLFLTSPSLSFFRASGVCGGCFFLKYLYLTECMSLYTQWEVIFIYYIQRW